MGQFGSLADMFESDDDTHAGWLAMNFHFNDRFSGYGQFLLTEGSWSTSDLHLDSSGVQQIPNGFAYEPITELQNFSDLRLRWWTVEGGLRQRIGRSYVLEYGLIYQDYDDGEPYLVDSTGSHFGAMIRANWIF